MANPPINFGMILPQDVQAQQQASRRDVYTNGSLQQQRSYNIENALDSLFGNPQMRQANRTQAAIKSAQKVDKIDGESDIDFELRRLTSMRDAVADVDPNAASEINARVLELGQAKFERSRLQASDDRASQKFGWEKEDHDIGKLTDSNTYVYDPKDGSAQSFNLRNPEETAKFLEARKTPGATVITGNQKWQLDLQNDAQAAALKQALIAADARRNAATGGGGSKVEAQRVELQSAGVLDQFATVDRMMQVLEDNPDVLSMASAGAQKFDQVAHEVAATGRALSGGKTAEGTSIDDWLSANGVSNPRAKSLVVALAAAQAKANNPDGRISNQDMDIAKAQVGGDNPNPAVLMANLNDTLTRSYTSVKDRLSTLDPEVQSKYKARLELIGKKFETFQQRFQKYATGSMGKGAAGADDIDDIVNKYKVPQQ